MMLKVIQKLKVMNNQRIDHKLEKMNLHYNYTLSILLLTKSKKLKRYMLMNLMILQMTEMRCANLKPSLSKKNLKLGLMSVA